MIAQLAVVTDEAIEQYIFAALARGGVTVAKDNEVTEYLGMIGVSNKRMRRRLGSMIKRRIVLRCRRQMESSGDNDRPITFKVNPSYLAM